MCSEHQHGTVELDLVEPALISQHCSPVINPEISDGRRLTVSTLTPPGSKVCEAVTHIQSPGKWSSDKKINYKDSDGVEKLNNRHETQSVFFSKYFPASRHSTQTQLHWKKVISGMSSHISSDGGGTTSANRQDCFISASRTTSRQNPPSYQFVSSGRDVERGHPAAGVSVSGCAHLPSQSLLQDTGHFRHKPQPSWDTSQNFTSAGIVGTNSNTAASMTGHLEDNESSAAMQDSQLAFRCGGDPELSSSVCVEMASSTFADSRRLYGTNTRPDREAALSEDQHQPQGQAVEELPHSTGVHSVAPRMDSGLCQVCQDVAAGFYCGAFVCEACKKFFIRASKQEKQKFVCLRQGMCKITKESRVQCQYCRYHKCLELSMFYPGEGKRTVSSLRMSGIPCRVCGAPSSGFHFGALTCEGCKGFFRRMVKEREPGMYKCSSGAGCEISAHTRNMCKACRYQKCISIGMSVEGSRIGRQPNAVKHAISLEVKKQCQQRPAVISSTSTVEPSSHSNSQMAVSSPPVMSSSKPPSEVGKPSLVNMDMKEETSPVMSLADVELTEVPAGLIVKQEPEDDDFDEQLMTTSLELANGELAHMCVMERAKSDILDEAVFRSSLSILWKRQMKHFEFHAQCVLRFAKKVPDFRSLFLDNQVVLVQNAIYPIVVLNHSRGYELETGFYNYFNFNKLEEQAIVEMCPDYTTLQEHFRHFGMIVKMMNMTDMEYTLLSCLLLFDPDCAELKAGDRVEHLQNRIIRFFQDYEAKTHANGMSRFGEMMLRISELTLAREQHMQTMSGFVAKHPYLEVPQLYREMFF